MTEDTLFDLASVTKPTATAVLVFRALEALGLAPEVPLGRFVSPLDPAVAEATILELLTHTSGLPPTVDIQGAFPDASAVDPADAERVLRAVRPSHARGERVVYSCAGFLLLGLFLRATGGARPGRLWADLVSGSAELDDLLFRPPPELRGRAATTELCRWRGRWIRGEVHDESSWCLGGDGGNAGLFGTARALLALLGVFRSGGMLGSRRLLAERSVRLMTSPATGTLSPRRSAGFALGGPEFSFGSCFGPDAFGHTGFTGTSVLVDPGSGLEAVVLTNRVHLGRAETAPRIVRFRAELHPLLLRTLGPDAGAGAG